MLLKTSPKTLVVTFSLIFASLSFAQDEISSLDRLVAEVKLQKGWQATATLSEKMNLIRDAALAKDVVSDPVSDRYLITALGGPIDYVHFLGLAIPVCSGEIERKAVLFHHWKDEGGEDFEAGKSRIYPPEAHPDDLPSNAFGALFGEEIRVHNNDPDFDIVGALKKFLLPLEPLNDDVALKYSHRTVVMGLSANANHETVLSRSEWFTAKPLFPLFAFDPVRARAFGDSSVALREAGFTVESYKGKPILIERIEKTPKREGAK